MNEYMKSNQKKASAVRMKLLMNEEEIKKKQRL